MTPSAATSSAFSSLPPLAHPIERIESRIYPIRGQKVLLDRDLAELYGVEIRVLNQSVRRNLERFPADFMFPLTRPEITRISQIVIASPSRKREIGFHTTLKSTRSVKAQAGKLKG